jgi:transcription-repair coupling factor (superfamily II helicase)
MHDLEIRGAGEVLGENQSGNMLEVGFQLYNEMLSEAVRCLKAGSEPDLLEPARRHHRDQPARPGPAARRLLRRRAPAPELLQEAGHRAQAPSQIDACSKRSSTASASCPPQGQTLIDVHRLRVLAKPYGVVKVDAAPGVITISFKKNPPIEPMKIIAADPEEQAHQAGGQRKAAHRARAARAQGRARRWCVTCCAAWGNR